MSKEEEQMQAALGAAVTLVEEIGRGSHGEVYLVENENQEQFAVKVINQRHDDARSEAVTQKELATLRALRRLDHAFLVTSLGGFEHEGKLYVAMEYCAGGDLARFLNHLHKALPQHLLLTWLWQIACGLEYLHSRHVLHRDLKPRNIYLTKEADIRLGDVGLAVILNERDVSGNNSAGTLPYLCPEALQHTPYTEKSDMWSLGCCVVEMATLQKLHKGTNIFLLWASVLDKPRQPLPLWYSKDLDSVTSKLLARDPQDRPSAAELLSHPLLQDAKSKDYSPLTLIENHNLTSALPDSCQRNCPHTCRSLSRSRWSPDQSSVSMHGSFSSSGYAADVSGASLSSAITFPSRSRKFVRNGSVKSQGSVGAGILRDLSLQNERIFALCTARSAPSQLQHPPQTLKRFSMYFAPSRSLDYKFPMSLKPLSKALPSPMLTSQPNSLGSSSRPNSLPVKEDANVKSKRQMPARSSGQSTSGRCLAMRGKGLAFRRGSEPSPVRRLSSVPRKLPSANGEFPDGTRDFKTGQSYYKDKHRFPSSSSTPQAQRRKVSFSNEWGRYSAGVHFTSSNILPKQSKHGQNVADWSGTFSGSYSMEFHAVMPSMALTNIAELLSPSGEHLAAYRQRMQNRTRSIQDNVGTNSGSPVEIDGEEMQKEKVDGRFRKLARIIMLGLSAFQVQDHPSISATETEHELEFLYSLKSQLERLLGDPCLRDGVSIVETADNTADLQRDLKKLLGKEKLGPVGTALVCYVLLNKSLQD